ncbi:cupin domain-containing protein [Chryseobacterium vrystaatense]|nr:cupin domain-containing protein [Chryseobacterium vrystaatense]
MESFQPLITFDMVEINNALEIIENLPPDNIMNQKVSFLTGDENASLFIIELNYNQSLPPHYHTKDIEIYYILSGQGTITTKFYSQEKNTDQLSQPVKKGDSFTIHPFQIHQISNQYSETLQILALAPSSHNGTDRHFAEL